MEKKIWLKSKKKWPNWKDPKDYDSLNNIDLAQWAWEFLKRNPKYIEEWERLTKGLTEKQKRENPYVLLCDKAASVSPALCDARKWGLPYGYLNPDLNIKDRNITFIPLGGEETGVSVSGRFKGTMFVGIPDYNTGQILLEFNFKQPIIPQIEVAKKNLLRLQDKSKKNGNTVRKAFKPRPNEWILLLRILDAMSAGAKDKEIARVLFPNEYSRDAGDTIKTVYDKRKQAMRYVNQDYRSIPYSRGDKKGSQQKKTSHPIR